MRITNAMMVSGYINNLNKGFEKMNRLQNQITTGKGLQRASDDPIAASKAMSIRSDLSRVRQYTNNVIEANEWLAQSESSLDELNTLLARVYELTENAANGTNGESERNAIADEIEQINEQIIVNANTTFKSKYVFGGLNITSAPFAIQDIAGEKVLFYNGHNVNELTDPANAAVFDQLKSEKISYEIGFGTSIEISYNGIDLLGAGADNTVAVLNNLVSALRSGDQETIRNSVGLVQEKHNEVISKLGEIGGKTNRLEFFERRLENDEYNYEVMQENTEGIETERAIMEYKMQAAIYEAALAAGSKVITLTLVDFLR